MDNANDVPASLRSIGVILIIGFASLLAGASLGPEASLLAASTGIGGWVASRIKLGGEKRTLILASVGALLVAFLGSIVMALVPLLILVRQKRLTAKSAGVILLAAASSYGILRLIDRAHPGYGSAPPLPHLTDHDYLVALLVGFVTAGLGVATNRLIVRLAALARRLDRRLSWQLSAGLFGLVLGGLYLLAGQSIEFSGNTGSMLLVDHTPPYTAAALCGLIIAKLLATTWSKSSGYRGGLVFPSIYIGVALGLLLGSLLHGWGGAGAQVGGIAGMLSAITGSAIVSAVFVLAVVPIQLLPVAILAIIGSAGCSWLLRHGRSAVTARRRPS
jgi:H+/Cl- antiporter ClcA